MIDDPEPLPLGENVLSDNGPFVVGLHQHHGHCLLDPDGQYFTCAEDLSDIDLAARFSNESEAQDAAGDRGMTVFQIVRTPEGSHLRVVE